MISDLDLLIKACEAEKKFLEKAIKESLADYDYLIAHYHSEALLEVNNRLSTLTSFKDPFHNEKDLVARMEKRLSKTNFSKEPFFKKLDSGTKKRMIDSFKESRQTDLDDRKKKLEALSKEKNGFFCDSQEIDQALFDLFDGVYKGFTLTINEHYELILRFERIGDQLIISTKQDIEFYEPDFIIDNRVPTHLIGLGFRFDPELELYIYKYDLTNFKDATPVKILLSRIIFDLYKLNDINQKCTLVYYN